MASSADIARFLDNLREERSAVLLYERLASVTARAELSELYRRLAQTERRHADVWERRLREAGADVPPWSAGWRTRVLGWLAARFGAAFVLPTIAGIEQGAADRYRGQPEAAAAGMPAEERSHARAFRLLAGGAGMDGRTVARTEGRHRATGGNALRAGVLGANDGLVSILILVMGVAGAAMSPRAILVMGVAGLLAGAISMALGEWLSVQSARELHGHQLAIEKAELEADPEAEREELALIYQAKGLAPAQARQVADGLLSDPARALDTLSREELGVDPDDLGGPAWEAAFTSFLLFAAGAAVPLLPFVFASGTAAVVWSCVCSGVGLFIIGAGITLVTGRSVWWSGLRQVLFGLVAAGITFAIGRLFGVQVAG